MQIERIYHPDIPSQMRAIMLLLRIRPAGDNIINVPEKETGQDFTGTRSSPSTKTPHLSEYVATRQA